jgi:hypothetical protein
MKYNYSMMCDYCNLLREKCNIFVVYGAYFCL